MQFNTLNLITLEQIKKDEAQNESEDKHDLEARNVNESQDRLILPKIHDDRFPVNMDFDPNVEKVRKYGKAKRAKKNYEQKDQ